MKINETTVDIKGNHIFIDGEDMGDNTANEYDNTIEYYKALYSYVELVHNQ